MHKPCWLNKKIDLSACHALKEVLRESGLASVCEEALCPNISECFSAGVATIIILGKTCTRQCSFCAVKKGIPHLLDSSEPARVRNAVGKLKLSYVVITSPTRDDLSDGGAGIFCQVVTELKEADPVRKVELLIPDFQASSTAIKAIAQCGADVVGHNVETVPALYENVRKGSDYARSLFVLKTLKSYNPNIITKSGLMLGLGENIEEVLGCLQDLKRVDCDFITLGQYLSPSKTHYPTMDYITEKQFQYLEAQAYALGFKKVKSSAYARSSYLAHSYFDEPIART